MTPGSTGRMLVALAVLTTLALLVWRTIEPGKLQQVTWLLLGVFAVRVLLLWSRSRRIGSGAERPGEDRADV